MLALLPSIGQGLRVMPFRIALLDQLLLVWSRLYSTLGTIDKEL